MNRDEFQQAQQKGLEAMQAFNSFTHDPEYPGRSYGHLSYYRKVIMPKGFHPMNEEVLREAFDAALEVCAYYPDRHFPDIPELPTREVVGPDHIRLLEGWFLKADEIITTKDRPPVLTDSEASGNGLSNLPDETTLPVSELAKRGGVDAEALRKRCDRLRKRDQKSFVEIANSQGPEARYCYKVSAVRPIIECMKASDQKSGKRPTEE